MDQKSKKITRFTFDCPTDIHCTLKMKAISYKKTVKDYLVGLIVRDLMTETPSFMDDEEFQKQLAFVFENDIELLRGLHNR